MRNLNQKYELTEFYQSHYQNLLDFALYFLGNKQDAEDALQESYLKAYKSLDKKEICYLSKWFHEIVANLCKSELRSRMRWRFLSIVGDYYDLDSEEPSKIILPDETYRPDVIFENKELGNIIDETIDELPVHYKEPFKMHFYEGFGYRRISNELHIPIGTVKSRVFRARNVLRESLLKRGIYP